MERLLGAIWRSHNSLGLLLAALFFSASLTPSLMPRDPVLQGLAGGLLAVIGYEIGRLLLWLWRFGQLPEPEEDRRDLLRAASDMVAVAVIAFCLWKAADWQNVTRELMGLAPIETSAPATLGSIAVMIFLVGRGVLFLLALLVNRLDDLSNRFLPPRIGRLVAFLLALWLVWAAVDGVLVTRLFRAADASFEAADSLIEPDVPRPTDPLKTGSSSSLVDWNSLGRWGRAYVSTGPTAEEIATFSGPEAKEPIRVYIGRRSAETAQARAELALKELIRAGGFERAALVVMVPVGTGWMDPGSHDPLEFIMGGDVATVAVQYSYLTSVLSLMADPDYGVDQAEVLFDTVYAYWRQLPRTARPKLYLHGLSQGAFNSQQTLPLLDLLADPIDGALWAGSPFFSRYWTEIRNNRNPGSPAWRPLYGNGSLARAMNQTGGLQIEGATWGPIRLVFLNYGSDPIVVFTFDSSFRPAIWLRGERAPDVTKELRWYPVVTMFQMALDMMISLKVPRFGHYYLAPDYIDGWAAVLDPPGWNAQRADTLKAIFEKRGLPF